MVADNTLVPSHSNSSCWPCNQDYICETGRRIIEQTADHNGQHFKHGCIGNHKQVDSGNIKVIDSGYYNSKFERKISEAFYIKQFKTSLNTQEVSVPLKLFN